jgi:2-dehydropantoate 2-reductase
MTDEATLGSGAVRVLVVGAGAVGGYFGGRLAEAGRAVTFLVRARRAEQLARDGLRIKSPSGDLHLASPVTVTEERLDASFDVVLLACKAYDLDAAMRSFAPAVGASTAIVPLLNGMRHLDVLGERFGAGNVLGGQCVVASTLAPDGTIVQLTDMAGLSYGELDGRRSQRVAAIEATFAGANFSSAASAEILQEMWEKWTFIATLAGMTCLMRAAIGDIVAADGTETTLRMYDEACAIASAHGFAPRPAALERARGFFGVAGSPVTASMLRDVEQGYRVEADHVLGDLLARAPHAQAAPLLHIAYLHLKAYEARRARTTAP